MNAQLVELQQEKQDLLRQLEKSSTALEQSIKKEQELCETMERQLSNFKEAQEKNSQAYEELRLSLDSAMSRIKSKDEEFVTFKNSSEAIIIELREEKERLNLLNADLQVLFAALDFNFSA